ncbi:single-strand binding family protein [Candidatus Endolissoclinum faulkneri L2]|uniref:Single-stranded DNA-binding protein n=1 Tax=Candidatus Endolissoclinum faulkneri L2 TaxID=1193729 RepID=K7YLN9_9PROT|nr:single-stranded DNA-binding protein [Candidatus Endolissoclinum faulkneri]AFX98402.1 single-strand binding family protein [Candidatus Endolissoclinum faulkneri L2]
MAGSINKAILIGNLGRDPEVRFTQDGIKIVNLAIATSDRWRDKNSGDQRERTEWHRVVIFNENLARLAEQYLRKGSLVYIEGQLQTRKWSDQNGHERYSTDIVLQRYRGQLAMLGNGNRRDYGTIENNIDGRLSTGYGSDSFDLSNESHVGGISELEDEIPF